MMCFQGENAVFTFLEHSVDRGPQIFEERNSENQLAIRKLFHR